MSVLLPPGLLLVLLAVLAVAVWKRRYAVRGHPAFSLTALSFWVGGIAILGWLFAMPAFGIFLSNILVDHIRGKDLQDPKQADMIVVLTGGMMNAGPVGWIPKPEGIQRLAVAYELQRMINLRLPVIISGGFTEGVQNPSEASVTASFFAHQRSELTPTELEESSTDTYESAMQLAPILAKRGVHNVLLVTSDVHMLRAAATFRARGVDVIPAPAMTLPTQMGIKAYLPSAMGMGRTADALYEMMGTAIYLLSGRISWADLAYTPTVVNEAAQMTAASMESVGVVSPTAITIEEPEAQTRGNMTIDEPRTPAAPGLLPAPSALEGGATGGGIETPDGVVVR